MTQVVIKTNKHPVLFVDDDELMRAQMARLFHRVPKVELLTAESAVKARSIIESQEIHVLVTDQRMPLYSGTDLLVYARRHQPNALRVLLTGHADADVLKDSINNGNLFRYYAKPVDPDLFVREVVEMLRIYERRTEHLKYRFLLNSKARDLQEANTRLHTSLSEKTVLFKDTQATLSALEEIGKNLSEEKDSDRLFRLVLNTCRNITNADAGTIYFMEGTPTERRLRMKYSYTHSRNIPFEDKVIPLDAASIAGYVALNQKSITIDDAYAIPNDLPYSFNPSFDIAFDYHTGSMAAIPIKGGQGVALGVIQLINRKTDGTASDGAELVLETSEDFTGKVLPFTPEQVMFLEAVAGQATIAIENAVMVRQLNSQFEGFVLASIKAIESRDQATSGHSLRVSVLCVDIARWLCLNESEVQALEYAALLHDIGKVYIEPAVLSKTRKLIPSDLARIQQTLDYMYRFQELSYTKHEMRVRDLETRTGIDQSLIIKDLHEERDRVLQRIKDIKQAIDALNEPGSGNPADAELLDGIVKELNSMKCLDIDERQLNPLQAIDVTNLGIKYGTLNAQERFMMEQHVNFTDRMVSGIPWPAHLESVPLICRLHHEKLDGSGYPSGIKGIDIPMPARILMVVDMFDALTAKDRGYREPASVKAAFGILDEGAKAGRIDPNVVAALQVLVENGTVAGKVGILQTENDR